MYTDIFLGDISAYAAVSAWIEDHRAAQKTIFTMADGSMITADISGNLDKDILA